MSKENNMSKKPSVMLQHYSIPSFLSAVEGLLADKTLSPITAEYVNVPTRLASGEVGTLTVVSMPTRYSEDRVAHEWHLMLGNVYTGMRSYFNLNILLNELATIMWPEPKKEALSMSIPITRGDDYHRSRVLADVCRPEKVDVDWEPPGETVQLMLSMQNRLKVDFLWLRSMSTFMSKPFGTLEWVIEDAIIPKTKEPVTEELIEEKMERLAR